MATIRVKESVRWAIIERVLTEVEKGGKGRALNDMESLLLEEAIREQQPRIIHPNDDREPLLPLVIVAS